jgi:hypothetical protein
VFTEALPSNDRGHIHTGTQLYGLHGVISQKKILFTVVDGYRHFDSTCCLHLQGRRFYLEDGGITLL